MPAESWFALAITEAGDAVRESLGEIASLGAQMGDPTLEPDAITGAIEGQTGLDLEEDLLAWVGNAAFFASGTSESELRVGGLLETSDSAASERAIAMAEAQFGLATGAPTATPKLEGATAGFSATGPGGESVEIALRDDLVVGAFGGPDPATELVEAEDSLADSPLFSAARDALGDDFEAAVFVAMQDFLVVAEKGDDGDTDYDAARPYTESLEYLIFGTVEDDGRERSRMVVGVGE